MTALAIQPATQKILSKSKGRGFDPNSLWERLAYGLGTALITTGPALLPGMGLTRWMIIFIALSTLVFIVLCLLGVFTSLRGIKAPTRRRRIVHPAS